MKIIGWIFSLMGLTLGLCATWRVYDKLTADAWPSTYAEVISSDMYHQTSKSSSRWCVKMRYRYAVDGVQFTSRRLATSLLADAGCDRDRSVIAVRMERYQPGARIKIRHHPDNAARSIVYLDSLDMFDYFFFPALTFVLCSGGVSLIRQKPRAALQAPGA